MATSSRKELASNLKMTNGFSDKRIKDRSKGQGEVCPEPDTWGTKQSWTYYILLKNLGKILFETNCLLNPENMSTVIEEKESNFIMK